MNLREKCEKLIGFSVLFDDSQKESWLGLLPKLNDSELNELYGILTEEVRSLKNEGIYIIDDPVLEKELMGSGVQHGASLEALKAAAGVSTTPQVKPSEFSAELKREVNMPELTGNVAPTPKPVMPTPAPAVPKLAETPAPALPKVSIPTSIKPIGSLSSIDAVKTLDDLKKIQVAHLRQGERKTQIQSIKNKIMSLIQMNKVLPYYAVKAFEDSPLYKSYLTIGSNLIVNPNPERAMAFRQAVEDSIKAGADSLEMGEFEALADLRKHLEQL